MTDEMMLSSFTSIISTMLNEKFRVELAPIKSDLCELKEDVSELKEDVSELKEDVAVLKEDVSELKEDVSVLKEDVAVLKEDVAVLKEDVAVLKEDVAVLKKDVSVLKTDMIMVKADQKTTGKIIVEMNERLYVVEEKVLEISLEIENSIKPDISLLAENYVPAALRYVEEVDKIRALQNDVKLLNAIVGQHSLRLDAMSK